MPKPTTTDIEFVPVSGRIMPRYAGLKTFFRLPVVDPQTDCDVALIGIPYDGSVTYRPGARFAPSKVREASSLGRGYHWPRGQELWSRLRIADAGDCPTVPIDQLRTYKQIEEFYALLLKRKKKKKIIAVGGDHSITLATLRAMHKAHGPLNFIHFDAHLDTYPAAWDCEYHHGSFLRHALEEGLLRKGGVFQVGIRGPLVDAADLDVVKKHKVNVTTVDDLRIGGLESYVKKMPKFNSGPTYISFDIDCLDPAFAPGTGTPVVGGLTTYETQRILRSLSISNLVGADVVEVSPPFDHADITALAAMDVMFELMHLC